MTLLPTHDLLRELYSGQTRRAERFRYLLLTFDVILFIYLIVISFDPEASFIPWVDLFFSLTITADFLARFRLQHFRLRYLFSVDGLLDIAILASIIITYFGEHMAFLRAIRFLRLVHSRPIRKQLAKHFRFFDNNDEIIIALLHLTVFIFVTTALVFETQYRINEHINDYVDALYFTVSTLTTTGFGDVTLKGDGGHLLSVCIMIFGVTLFIRLIQAAFRAHKVQHMCPQCGLQYHDRDAVHCKACGIVLCIKDDGIS